MGIEGMGTAARSDGAEQEGRSSTGIQGLLPHQHRSLGAAPPSCLHGLLTCKKW